MRDATRKAIRRTTWMSLGIAIVPLVGCLHPSARVRAVVHGRTFVTDSRGRSFPALAVRRFVRPALEEAIALDPEAPNRVMEYYVSDAPPYYLGYRGGRIDEAGKPGGHTREHPARLPGTHRITATSARGVARDPAPSTRGRQPEDVVERHR